MGLFLNGIPLCVWAYTYHWCFLLLSSNYLDIIIINLLLQLGEKWNSKNNDMLRITVF
jgi:hypothetical protein